MWISRHGAERGIPIATCPGVNSGIVAELAIMLMLAGYRNLLQINRQRALGIGRAPSILAVRL